MKKEMNKKMIIGLVLVAILGTIIIIKCVNTSYNFNEYTESEVTTIRVKPDGTPIKNLYNKMKDGSKIKFTGVVTGFDYGYTEEGEEIFFYRIQPIYKGETLEYTKNTYGGLLVLSPISDINNQTIYHEDYLGSGDVVRLEGYYVKCGEYYTCEQLIGDKSDSCKWNYIQMEEVEVLEKAD